MWETPESDFPSQSVVPSPSKSHVSLRTLPSGSNASPLNAIFLPTYPVVASPAFTMGFESEKTITVRESAPLMPSESTTLNRAEYFPGTEYVQLTSDI